MAVALYTGEDVTIVIDLVDDTFSLMADVIVGVIINDVLKVSFKKTTGTVIAVSGQTKQCSVLLTRAITKGWEAGMLSMEVTKVFTDASYPSNKHVIYKDNIVQFSNALTKNL
jgi:hypothetical protein